MNDFEIKVNGMVCSGCEARVKNAVSTIKGVEKVEASHETGIVKVTANEGVTLRVIEEIIEDIGFEVLKD